MMSLAFLLVAAASFASFLSSVFLIFHAPAGRTPGQLTTLKLGSVVTWILLLAAIRERGDVEPLRASVALALQIAALALFWSAAPTARQQHLSVAFMPSAPGELVSQGPFRLFLHPFYAAYAISYWSVVLYTLHWIALVPTVFMHCLYSLAAHREEQLLLATFGDEYAEARRKRLAALPGRVSTPFIMAAVLIGVAGIARIGDPWLGDEALKEALHAIVSSR